MDKEVIIIAGEALPKLQCYFLVDLDTRQIRGELPTL
jgi:hypothetical protein